ncbi:MAG TPA: metallopeptidase TldD-related protein [Candidatus Acidoferrales bacterium]|nr:metallopeptidase TldD-related protein [Candidatus Acidoferrales bacterium]
MRHKVAVVTVFVLFLFFVPGRAGDDPVMTALREEMARSMQRLQLENLEKPYFIAYRVDDVTGSSASASFGSLLGSAASRSRFLTVEVRVGDYAFDNTNFMSFGFGDTGVARMFGGMVTLPLEDDEKEMRRQIWLATDGAYKKALEDLSKKRAALQNKTRTEEIPDFSHTTPANTTDVSPAAELNRADAEKLVRELSALFRAMPDVFRSEVSLAVQNMNSRYLNSEGAMFVRTVPLISLTARAETQAPDGMPLADGFALYGRSMSELPAKEDVAARIRAMGGNLSQLRNASPLEQYNGPVLFEGQAAAELFSQVFVPALLGRPRTVTAEPQFDQFMAQSSSPLLDKVGSRVLPTFLSVADNPGATIFGDMKLFGGRKVDDDGVPTHEVRLVEKGILKTLLVTRRPVRGILQSSGSRRGSGPGASNLFVSAEGTLSEADLKAELIKLVQQRSASYGILVRRMTNPMLAGDLFDSLASMMAIPGREPAGLRTILLAYKVFPDGREELVRNAELSGITVATFKEIVAASRTQSVSSAPPGMRNISAFSFDIGEAESIAHPVSLVVPSLLFEDLSLKKPSGEFSKPPIAKHPFFEK